MNYENFEVPNGNEEEIDILPDNLPQNEVPVVGELKGEQLDALRDAIREARGE
jgi:hypothetical protein